MKAIFVLIALLFTTQANAVFQAAPSPTLKFGAFTYAGVQYPSIVDLAEKDIAAGWIIYKPWMPNTVNSWSPFLKNGTHQAVTAGKTLSCYSIAGGPFGVQGVVQMGCSSAAVTFGDTDLNATTPKYEFGSNTAAQGHQFPLSNAVTYSMTFQCAAGTFPAMQATQTNTNPVWFVCQEK